MPKKHRATDAALPNDVGAAWFACQCFGVGTKELTTVMKAFRKRDKHPRKTYPKKLSTELLKRAKNGNTKWNGVLKALCRRAVYDRIYALEKSFASTQSVP